MGVGVLDRDILNLSNFLRPWNDIDLFVDPADMLLEILLAREARSGAALAVLVRTHVLDAEAAVLPVDLSLVPQQAT